MKIPFSSRLIAILHLCLAFSTLCWYGSLPFSGQLFEGKKRTLLFQNVMGRGEQVERLATDQQRALLKRHAERFAALPKEQQQWIKGHYEQFLEKREPPFWQKVIASIETLTIQMPSLVLLWLLLSIALPIMLLLDVENSATASWLLPLIAFAYAGDTLLFAPVAAPTSEEQLFPSEAVLIAHHIEAPLSNSLFEQQQQLNRAWEHYLTHTWAPRSPTFQADASEALLKEEGAFAFNLARLNASIQTSTPALPQKRDGFFLLACYCLWNSFFAWQISRGFHVVQQSITRPT